MAQKRGLITGASRGLGLALARALADRGWRLVIDARSAQALEAARLELAEKTTVIAVPGDIAEAGHRLALVQAAQDLGGLDLLVNNASILGPSPQPALLDYPLEVLENVYRTNVIAPLALLQAARPALKPGARIINITSDAANEAYAGWGGYGSSKAALEQISAVLAAEETGWRIFWVDPGDMRTQMQQEAFPDEDISDRPLPETSVPGLLALIEGGYPGGRYQARALGVAANIGANSGADDSQATTRPGIRELRVALTVSDPYGTARLLQAGLGLPLVGDWSSPEGTGLLLAGGPATLELIDAAQSRLIDQVELGAPASGPVRLAVEVADLETAAQALSAAGGQILHGPVITPWGDRNLRLQAPDGLQITLFEAASHTASQTAAGASGSTDD